MTWARRCWSSLGRATAFCCALMPALPVAAENNEARQAMVTAVARDDGDCKALGDFYWEIGDAKSVLGSGAVGSHYSAGRTLKIASASKLVFGAYVLEKIGKGVEPSPAQIVALSMRSGYTSFKPFICAFASTVQDCFALRHNGEFTPANVGKFYYNGGHDQKLAIDMGLSSYTNKQFADELRRYLGSDLDFAFEQPQPAGGITASPAGYGRFLRKILAGDLRMKDYLGAHAVCTLPSHCATAAYSPIKTENPHYSLNHWVEDDPATGDGSFSSPGLLGFYPWISADKRLYGILARQELSTHAAWDSVVCGRKLRRAWMTGEASK